MKIQPGLKLTIGIVAMLVLVNPACSLTKGKGIAEAAVVHFHEQYNAGKFREIYSQTDEGFKKATTEADFISLCEALQRKLGSVKNSTPAGWGVNATPTGTIATLGYDVDFTEGKGSEQFVFRISGDKALLYNYNVNSPLLITK